MNTIYLSLGSNIGNRYEYMTRAISLLAEKISDIQYSQIYETKPWGYDNQNNFLNMMIEAKTALSPIELLAHIQHVQNTIGRDKTILNGPRTIDIDIVFYNQEIIKKSDLIIPHPRAHTRDFVLIPMLDINPDYIHPQFSKTITELIPTMTEPYILKKHIPTQIVGILNLSPESFGSAAYTSFLDILQRVEQMVAEGVDIIDIGAQSTKPGSLQLTEEVEPSRLRGVIRVIKEKFPHIKISIDTTRLVCIRLALEEGADMINDISGARFAPELLPLIVNTGVKIVIMHSQGDFSDIHKKYQYDDIITELLNYFQRKIQELLKIGLRPDQIILDPGIGFSKGATENFAIIGNIEKLKTLGYPLYIGLSRKKFLGKDNPLDRDVGTTILHTLCMQKGVEYIRVHNVEYAKQVKTLLQNI